MTYLTREGRKALKSVDPAVGRYTDLTTGGMSPDELAQLERLLTVYIKTVADPTRLWSADRASARPGPVAAQGEQGYG